MAEFGEKNAIICSKVLLDLSNFTGGLSLGKSQTLDRCLVSGTYSYIKVSLPGMMSETPSDVPSANFRSF